MPRNNPKTIRTKKVKAAERPQPKKAAKAAGKSSKTRSVAKAKAR